jgi:SAM-dependent methyltransferase
MIDTNKLTERAQGGLHEHIEQILSKYTSSNDMPLLDVGAGTGAFLLRLKKAGYTNLSGVDIAVPKIEIDGVSFFELDLDTGLMPFPDSSIMMITCIEIIEHIESQGHFIKELVRILKPEGSLIITTPNLHSLEARLRFLLNGKLKQFDEKGDPTHISPLFLYPFSKILDRYNLSITEAWGFPTDGSSLSSRWLLKFVSKMLSYIGFRSEVSGDQLCIRLQKKADSTNTNFQGKKDNITSHY